MKIIAYLIIFLEGGALLSFELMAAKMYTPHVGSTLYVWTSILTLTLISLAISYRLSQFFIDKKKWGIVPILLLIAGLYILLLVFTRNEILSLTYQMELKAASIFTGIILLFVPILCMGITSPMISAKLATLEQTSDCQNVGNSAGIIYGIGTLSGVVLTLLSLFVLMPRIGVNFVIVILAFMLISSGVLSYFLIKKTA
ncbi:MAG: fused MFS/spermidine synthase [Bacteroidetes bacterium]|nr:fused MFS/spermidine synthase [Bacteroidota bacterium]